MGGIVGQERPALSYGEAQGELALLADQLRDVAAPCGSQYEGHPREHAALEDEYDGRHLRPGYS